MAIKILRFNTGVAAALGAALLFGTSAPIAKWLLQDVSPWMLAGLFYLGSGIGLSIYRLVTHTQPVSLQQGEAGWLAGAILTGGVAGPVLLMFGLTGMPASGAALLLNAEGVLTALLAWVVFKENFDRRIAAGMLAIAGGAVVLLARRSAVCRCATFLGDTERVPVLGYRQQPDPQSGVGRRHLDCRSEGHGGWQCQSGAGMGTGRRTTQLVDCAICDGGWSAGLRVKSCAFCGWYAASRHCAYWSLFLHRSILWRHPGGAEW